MPIKYLKLLAKNFSSCNMRIVAIVESRMSSTRLFGKILLKVKNKTMLEYLIERLQKVKKINDIVIATTINKLDDQIVSIAKKKNIKFFRGSNTNVLERVINAAEKFKADIIVRVTSDCPIIDVNIINQAIDIFLNNNCHIVTNAFVRSYPDGMDVEVLSYVTLKKSLKYAKDKDTKEHITLAIHKRPKIFKQFNLFAPLDHNWPKLGLTLDELKDYKLLKLIINHFYTKNKFFTCLDVIKFLKTRKKLLKINENVVRTSYNYEI